MPHGNPSYLRIDFLIKQIEWEYFLGLDFNEQQNIFGKGFFASYYNSTTMSNNCNLFQHLYELIIAQ